MKCNEDCFNCIFDDCIVDKIPTKKEKVREAKEMPRRCHFCKTYWDEPRHIIRYKRKAFCDEDCLAEYLLSKAEDDIEVEWFDTEENMRICAEEARHDDFI